MKDQIHKTTLARKVDFFWSARIYASEYASRQAWEKLDSAKHQGHISAFRLLDPESNQQVVVAISERVESVRAAARKMRAGGEPWQAPEDLIERLAIRRARVTVEGGQGQIGSEVNQRARYGGGALLDKSGRMRLRHRPQG